MHLHTRNVNTAFRTLVELFATRDEKHAYESQLVVRETYKNPNGEGFVLRINEPVCITYTHPKERVLFNEARDCNPYFQLYESLWMLAGRNDVKPLQYYNSKVGTYSDDGETINGAYGYRWRHSRTAGQTVATYSDERDRGGLIGPGTQTNRTIQRVDIDQLDVIISHLQKNPNSRRAVLTMWNVEDDLLKIDSSKDVCCNLNVMFSIRTQECHPDAGPLTRAMLDKRYLDMTVTNRSNDLVWGLLGTNYVHFSLLQEYMAARLGVEVGVYNHFTNNLHVYDWNFKPDEWLKADNVSDGYSLHTDVEGCGPIKLTQLVKDPTTFERELPLLVQKFNGDEQEFINGHKLIEFEEPFFRDVCNPMFLAFKCYKQKSYYSALRCVEEIQADDWKIACTKCLKRRQENASKRTQDDKV